MSNYTPGPDYILCDVIKSGKTKSGLHVPQSSQKPRLIVRTLGANVTFGKPGDQLIVSDPEGIHGMREDDTVAFVFKSSVVGLIGGAS